MSDKKESYSLSALAQAYKVIERKSQRLDEVYEEFFSKSSLQSKTTGKKQSSKTSNALVNNGN